MKKSYVFLLNFALVWAFVLIGFVSVFSQNSAVDSLFHWQEIRPFDFSDEYYYENGIEPAYIVNRRDGRDEHSVEDAINDPRFRNVRILSVFPAYNQDGKILYWNLYGEFYKSAFRRNEAGGRASEQAHAFPLYFFPSKSREGGFRQAHLIHLRDGYFEKNVLGLGVRVAVEFTDRILTEDGQLEMASLAARNGYSKDGTPIIKTALEIEDLTRKNYVTQKIMQLYDPSQPPYAVAKVIQNPLYGAIAPDAVLLNYLGLKAEDNFVQQFGCLQKEGKWCGR